MTSSELNGGLPNSKCTKLILHHDNWPFLKQVAATQDLGLENLPLPALFAGAMLLPRDQVTAKMLKDLLTTQVLTSSMQDSFHASFTLNLTEGLFPRPRILLEN